VVDHQPGPVLRPPASRGVLERIYEIAPGNDRLLAMEGMRGVAVLLVFCVHYHVLFRGYLADTAWMMSVSRYVGAMGHAGVDLFFVLSGLLIYGATIRHAAPYARFMRRRVQRIYPTFLGVLSLYLLLSLLFPVESKIPRGALPAAGYLLANVLLLPGIFPIEPVITVAWSLSYEFCYYLTVPLLVAALGMRSWPRGYRAAFLVGLFAAAVASPVLIGGARSRMGMFIPGMLLFEVMESGGARRWLGPRGERAAVAAFVAGLAVVAALRPSSGVNLDRLFLRGASLRLLILGPSFFLFALFAFAHAGRLGRWMEWRPLRHLGNMSYSYYLLHGLTLTGVALVLGRVLPPAPGRTLLFLSILPGALAATFVTSTGLFLLIEKPLSLSPPRRRSRREAAASEHPSPAAVRPAMEGTTIE
jgi:peptidoglycan/LPS O-acetylase OafA/YrhL